eukprot:525194-Hanusia_phi.AAC.1
MLSRRLSALTPTVSRLRSYGRGLSAASLRARHHQCRSDVTGDSPAVTVLRYLFTESLSDCKALKSTRRYAMMIGTPAGPAGGSLGGPDHRMPP